MESKKVSRLILKDEDILVVHCPLEYFRRGEGRAVLSVHKRLKEMLLPRKNKILILPEVIELSVIGKEQIEEYISHVDLWSLFDEEGEQIEEL
jgi:hypothetical protein